MHKSLTLIPLKQSPGNKLVAFESGELHISQVEMSDLRRTYACRLVRLSSGPSGRRILATSGQAQLILAEASSVEAAHWQLLHSSEQVVGMDVDALAQRSAVSSARLWWRQGPSAGQSAVRQQAGGARRTAPVGGRPPRLLLPCAYRAPSGLADLRAQWFVQPSSKASGQLWAKADTRRQPYTTLEHFEHSLALQLGEHRYQHQHTPQQAASNSSSWSPRANQQPPPSRLIVGPTYLSIEWPRAELSARYTLRVAVSQVQMLDESNSKSICDINVMIRRPIELRVTTVGLLNGHSAAKSVGQQERLVSSGADSDFNPRRQESAGRTWLAAARDWLTDGPLGGFARRQKRQIAFMGLASNLDSTLEDFAEEEEQEEWRHVKVTSGAGKVPNLPHFHVGQRLELQCLASGQPIDSIKWFRNGQAITAQTSADFQMEISNTLLSSDQRVASENGQQDEQHGKEARLKWSSVLLIKQLQPRDVGVQVFECFASNALGDRERASLLVHVAERHRSMEPTASRWNRSSAGRCPLETFLGDSMQPYEQVDSSAASSWWWSNIGAAKSSWRQGAEDEPQAPSSAPFSPTLNVQESALLIEGEPVELICPSAQVSLSSSTSLASNQFQQQQRIDWFKWTGKSREFLSSSAYGLQQMQTLTNRVPPLFLSH